MTVAPASTIFTVPAPVADYFLQSTSCVAFRVRGSSTSRVLNWVPRGPFGCPVLVNVLSCENRIRLYLWNASPRSGCSLALSTRHSVLYRILPVRRYNRRCTANFFIHLIALTAILCLVFGSAFAGASNAQGRPFWVVCMVFFFCPVYAKWCAVLLSAFKWAVCLPCSG